MGIYRSNQRKNDSQEKSFYKIFVGCGMYPRVSQRAMPPPLRLMAGAPHHEGA